MIEASTRRYGALLEETLPTLREAVERAAERSGRRGSDVTVVAVTKGHPLEALEAARLAGLEDLAENRVGELEDKVRALGRDAVRWHMVGHVQRRKAPRLLEIADLIHSVDSMRLAERFDRVVGESGVEPVEALVQVNTSGEEAKGGFTGENAVESIHRILELPGLRVRGLMTMAPLTDDEALLRRTFARLRDLQERAAALPGYAGRELSMGMSNDYALAVEEGSTMIRVGTALFGERPE